MKPSKLSQRESRNNTMSIVSKQHSLPLNRINIDKELSLEIKAPNGVNAAKGLEVKHADRLMETMLDDLNVWIDGDRNIKRRTYKNTLSMLLANAIKAHEWKAQILALRGKRHYKGADNPLKINAETMNNLLEFMADRGLVDYATGCDNEFDGVASWFIPLPPLIRQLEGARIFAVNGCQVVVRKERKKSKGDKAKTKAWPKSDKVLREVGRLSRVPTAYNAMMVQHDVRVGRRKRELLTHLYRAFTEKLELGGRFYAPDWQQIPKADRARITIDGSPTVEQDFKTLHWNMIYAEAGLQLEGDPYLITGYARDTIKALSFVILNSDSLGV